MSEIEDVDELLYLNTHERVQERCQQFVMSPARLEGMGWPDQ
jgi:hypothetical protein